MQTTANTRAGGAVPADPAPRVRLFWWLLLATVFVVQLPLPVRLAAGAFCLAAFWAGITALNRLAAVRRYARWVAGPPSGYAPPGYPPPGNAQPGYVGPAYPPPPPPGDAEANRKIVTMATRRVWPIGVGLGLTAVLSFSVISDAVFYRLNADTEECLAGANTDEAHDLCLSDRQQELQKIVDRLTSRLDAGRAALAPRST